MAAHRSFHGQFCASCAQPLASPLPPHLCSACGRAFCARCSSQSFPLLQETTGNTCLLCRKTSFVGLESEKQAESDGRSSLDSEFSPGSADFEVTPALSATNFRDIQHKDYAEMQLAGLCSALLQSQGLPVHWHALAIEVVR